MTRYEMDCTMEPADNGAWVRADEAERMEAELDEVWSAFNAQTNAIKRATEAWRKETGEELVSPDMTRLILWLLRARIELLDAVDALAKERDWFADREEKQAELLRRAADALDAWYNTHPREVDEEDRELLLELDRLIGSTTNAANCGRSDQGVAGENEPPKCVWRGSNKGMLPTWTPSCHPDFRTRVDIEEECYEHCPYCGGLIEIQEDT